MLPAVDFAPPSQNVTPSDSHFHKLAQSLQLRAWADVGIDAMTLADMQREHAALCANQKGSPLQCAAEILDLSARRRLMQAIGAAYGRLYLQAPDCYLWLGFAAIAVNDGVGPTADLAISSARLLQLLRATVRTEISQRVAGLAEDGVKAAFQVNFAIFADLYWVHLAYREGGLLWLRGLYRCGAIGRELFDAFARIDQGRQTACRDLIEEGNCLLFQREQEVSVTPVFRTYRHALAAATALGFITLPNRELKESGRQLALPMSFSRAGSYGPFAARWQWLKDCGWRAFTHLHHERRMTLQREVHRAIAGRPEGTLGQLRQLVATAAQRS